MNVLLELFRHNTLMNDKLLDTCRQLDDQQLGKTVEGTYGSIGATLVHIANAQAGYTARLLDVERPDRLAEDPFPGCEAVAALLALGNARLEEAVTRADLDRKVQVRGDDPPGLWWMPVSLYFLQAINHATEHRSHIATILTQLGVQPPEMDGWTFFLESGHLTPVSS